MAWSIPSLQDLVERSRASFATHMPGSDATVFPSNLYVAAKVVAARIYELFHRQDWIAKQAFPITATGEYLERHAQVYGINRGVDLPSTGYVLLSGGTHTTLVPMGTQWQDANGVVVQSTQAVYIDSDGSALIPVEAVTTGAGQEIDASEEVTMLAVIAGVPTTGQISTAGFYGGTDVETDEALRVRLLERLRNPPNAGSESDYVRWAKEIPGVTRVWAAGNAYGPGTVGVFFAMDDAYANGIPNAADAAMVQAYIDTLKPITANVVVTAPVAWPVPIEITGLTPYDSTTIANVKTELEAMIKEKSQVSTPGDLRYLRRSWFWQAVANATGERYHTVVLPDEDLLLPTGFLPVYDDTLVTISP